MSIIIKDGIATLAHPQQNSAQLPTPSLEMRYEQAYRQHGLRQFAHLANPRINPIRDIVDLELAMWHYYDPHQVNSWGISQDNPLVKYNARNPISYHIADYTKIVGNTKKKQFNFRRAIKAYHKKNQHIKWARTDRSFKSTLPKRPWNVIVDYSLMGKNKEFRYAVATHLYQFETKYTSYLEQLSQFIPNNPRHHFIIVRVPDTIPTIQQFKLAAFEMRKMYYKLFPDYDTLVLLDIWKWIDHHHRQFSILGQYIKDRDLSAINILFTYKDKCVWINLMKLHQWITGESEEDIDEKEESSDDINDVMDKKVDSKVFRIQRLYHRLLTTLQTSGTPTQVDTLEEKESKEIELIYADPSFDENAENDVEEVTDDNPEGDWRVAGDNVKAIEEPDEFDDSLDEEPIDDTEDDSDIDDGDYTSDIDDTTEYSHDDEVDGEEETTGRSRPRPRDEDISVVDQAIRANDSDDEEETDPYSDTKLEDTPYISDDTLFDDTLPDYSDSVVNTDKDEKIHRLLKQYRNGIIRGSISDDPDISEQVMTLSTLLEQAEDLDMTPAQAKRWETISKSYRAIKAPYGDTYESLESFVNRQFDANEIKDDPSTIIPDMPLTTDKTMLKCSLNAFDKEYIKKGYRRDVVRNVLAVQKAGVYITKYEIETKEDVANTIEYHVIQFTPIGGTPNTLRIPIPKLAEDGSYLSRGVRYKHRKLRVDKPIRRVSPYKVALTTYYGKLFVTRTMSKRLNRSEWILKQVDELVHSGTLTNVQYGKVFNMPYKGLSPIIAPLLTRYRSFTNPKLGVTLDFTDIQEKNARLTLGEDITYDPIKDVFINIHTKETYTSSELLGIDIYNAPDDYAEVKISGQMIPVGFILAKWVGLGKLLQHLNLEYDRYEVGQRVSIEPHQLMIRFGDEKWVFDKRGMHERDRLLITGFTKYAKQLRRHSAYDFDGKDVYGAVLQENGIGVSCEREIDLILKMFIDDISYQVLQQMGEPTEVKSLFIRAVELLTQTNHVDEINMDDMMIKGNERIAGSVYRQMVVAMRAYNSKPISAKRRFDFKPDEVWKRITSDPSQMVVNDINYIHALKETENVTFTGEGGRSKRSMVKRTRGFDETDLGVISEATVDSGDVGITTYLSANPSFDSYYGNTFKPDDLENNPSAVLSTSTVLNAFATNDDGNRIGFIGIQGSHRIPIKGAMPNPIRTGYETVLAHRLDSRFAYVAEADGKIIKVAKKYIIVDYDGVQKTIDIGLRIATAEGSYYAHEVVCDLPVGHEFKKGDVLTFNTAFFARDILMPTQVVPCDRIYTRTMLIENPETYEDSCAISTELAGQMESTSVKQRAVVINADDVLMQTVRIGQAVDVDTELTLIEDANIAKHTDGGAFDRVSFDVLKRLSRQSPKSHYKGEVIAVDVVYFCEEEELSESIRDIVAMATNDKFSGRKLSASDKRKYTGQISDPMKVGKSSTVGPGQVGITFYIRSRTTMASGDKAVLGLQLKTTISRVWEEGHISESGLPVHAMFSYSSISDRIVSSAELLGTTYSLLKKLTQRALDAYDGKGE